MTGPRSSDQCLGCGAALEPGVLVDRGHANVESPLRWAPGELDRGPAGSSRVPRHEWREPVPVAARRCTGCGRIELFAQDASVRVE